ncbi:MAG: hypothetical protein M1839_000771 [Geoglossum umbratile]|nr:MAG: hypothetical protein M1839_000771 [Geoglossum umbratile]
MDHPPKRQRLFRAGRNSGAIGANLKGGDGGIESHVASTDDGDEGTGHLDLHFKELDAANPVESKPPMHTSRRVSADRIAEARHWGLHRRLAQDLPAMPTETVVVLIEAPVSPAEVLPVPVEPLALPAETPAALAVMPAAPTETVIVAVEQGVIDGAGNSSAVVTLSTASLSSSPELPTVPAVPPFPSDLTPPAVPPFPTNLTPPPVPLPTTPPSTPPTPLPTTTSFPISSSFSSFGNSTSTGFSNGTTTSFLKSTTESSTSLLNSTTTSTTSTTSTEISTTSSTETTFSNYPSSSGIDQGSGGHATSTASGTPTGGAGGGSGPGLNIQKPAIIGGLVGGLAGFALMLVLALLLIRSRKRKNRRSRSLDPASTSESVTRTSPPGGGLGGSSTWPLSGRSAGILGRFRPITPQPGTADAAPASERGFYKVSGRKITPVLGSGGGDGFGGGYGKQTLGSPDDPHGAGPASQLRSSDAMGGGGDRVVLRPSPARTPEVSTPTRSLTDSSPGGRPLRPFRDGLGRSHPSEDGSKASRFVEDV